MKPLIEKLPLSNNQSFVARTYRTPHFEVPWHQHIEVECILFTEGEGVAFVGNHVGEFKTGDVFFLGSNLPHCFQKASKDMITSAVVIQFNSSFWGDSFLNLPENQSIRDLLQAAAGGIKLSPEITSKISPIIKSLEFDKEAGRIINLYQLLWILSSHPIEQVLSTQEVREYNTRQKERIDSVFQFSFAHFQESITLEQVATHAGMSVPAFCSYFKKSTKKTYTEFLNELRIAHACKLLVDTSKPIMEICFESGYNTLAHFNKQFLRLRHITPQRFRKKFNSTETIFTTISQNNRVLLGDPVLQ